MARSNSSFETKVDSSIPAIEYAPHHELSEGVEVCELKSVYERAPEFCHDPYSPHRVQFHHLIYIAEGAGTHFIDFIRYPCIAGSFMFVSKNQVHAFDRENQPLGLMVLFTQDFLDSIHASMRLPTFASGFDLQTDSPIQTVDDQLQTSCEALLAEIHKVTGENCHDRLIVQLLMAALLLKLRDNRDTSRDVRLSEEKRQQFSHFISLIEHRFHDTKDAAVYAQLLGISYKTLNEVCKKAAQQTPKQLIDAHTILEAKRRLAIEEIQVTQLAYDLGFNEVTNFIKFFKKHTNDTPNQFQRGLPG